MAADDPKTNGNSGEQVVKVSDWNACFNSESDVIALYCTVSTENPGETITGVGLTLNNVGGLVLASCYTELDEGSSVVSPALNLLPGGLEVGHTIEAVVSGEAAGQHFFFEQKLTITKCPE